MAEGQKLLHHQHHHCDRDPEERGVSLNFIYNKNISSAGGSANNSYNTNNFGYFQI